jgi:RHS repeat-associated protein
MSDGSGDYAYFYDAVGNLIREQKSIAGVTYTTEYSYDAAGILTGVTYPDGRVVAYELDDAGRVIRVTTSSSGEPITLAEDLSYLPFGPLSGLTYGNGISLSKTFDQRYQTKNLETEAVLDFAYQHDGTGNITRITNTGEGSRSQSFGYNHLNHLTSATGIYGSLGYFYNGVGNRLTKTVSGQPDLYEYGPGTNHLIAIADSGVTPVTLAYDANGNTTAMGEKQFFYGENNRMIEALSGGSVVGEYFYNGLGQRIIKRTAEGTVIYHYDPQGQLIAETDQNGKTLRAYFYVADRLLATLYRGGSLRKIIEDGAEQIEGVLAGQDKRVQWQLRSVLRHLNHALEDRKGNLWLDGFHLVSKPRGGNVFQHLHQAIRELGISKWAKLAPDLKPMLEKIGADLLKVVENLSRTCYEEAEAGAGDSTRWLIKCFLSRTERNLLRGEKLLTCASDVGKKFAFYSTAKAVHYFSSAWYLSQWVMRLADVSPFLGAGGEEVLAFVHTDHLGTPLKLTDENGTVVWRADYKPFGEATIVEDPDGDGEKVSFNFRFPGQYYDEETGLHYNYFRYYDPKTGRYLKPDPIGLLGGINLFVYSLNNPVNLIDPLGLQQRWDLISAYKYFHAGGNVGDVPWREVGKLTRQYGQSALSYASDFYGEILEELNPSYSQRCEMIHEHVQFYAGASGIKNVESSIVTAYVMLGTADAALLVYPALPLLLNQALISPEEALYFAEGLLPATSPKMTPGGIFGYFVGRAVEEFVPF